MHCPYCQPQQNTPIMSYFPQMPPKPKKPSLKKMYKDMRQQMEVFGEIIEADVEYKKKKSKGPLNFNVTPFAVLMLAAAPFVGIGSSFWFLSHFKEVIPLLLK